MLGGRNWRRGEVLQVRCEVVEASTNILLYRLSQRRVPENCLGAFSRWKLESLVAQADAGSVGATALSKCWEPHDDIIVHIDTGGRGGFGRAGG